MSTQFFGWLRSSRNQFVPSWTRICQRKRSPEPAATNSNASTAAVGRCSRDAGLIVSVVTPSPLLMVAGWARHRHHQAYHIFPYRVAVFFLSKSYLCFFLGTLQKQNLQHTALKAPRSTVTPPCVYTCVCASFRRTNSRSGVVMINSVDRSLLFKQRTQTCGRRKT